MTEPNIIAKSEFDLTCKIGNREVELACKVAMQTTAKHPQPHIDFDWTVTNGVFLTKKQEKEVEQMVVEHIADLLGETAIKAH